MAFSRRKFLRYAAGSGLMLGLGKIPLLGKDAPGASGTGTLGSALRAGNPLRLPPLLSSNGLSAGVIEQEVWPGVRTDVWTYGFTYPSPTIRKRMGESFTLRLTNQLPDHTNIHWHGLNVPASMDGHPKDVVHNGGSFDYTFTVQQRAGTYWYHPHPHMMTGMQVYKGMAGFFIVEDEEEQALGLPSGEYDVPLLVQDRRLPENGEIAYNPGEQDLLEGFLGDVILANGTPDAYLQVARRLYRFRVLNGSNARILNLGLSDNRPFHLIGTDGGLLDKPYQVTSVMLAPAERVELLIDFSSYAPGSGVVLKSLEFHGGTDRQQGAPKDILHFDIGQSEAQTPTIPTTLTTIEPLNPDQAVRARTFELRSDFGSPPMHSINGKMFEMTRVDEQVKPGDLEIWTFFNRSQHPHPMHVHGTQFQVLDRDGDTNLHPKDRGWKDTVLVEPYVPVRIAIRFPANLGLFMLHCHNLEHEDHGMMLNVEITETMGVDDGPGGLPKRMDLQ